MPRNASVESDEKPMLKSPTFDHYRTQKKIKHQKAASDSANLSDLCQIFDTSFDRLQNKSLQGQRFAISQKKTQQLSFLALGAKLERALSRRLVKQDANPPRRTGAELNALEKIVSR